MMIMRNAITFLALVVVAIAAFLSSAVAQTWPQRPVKFVLPLGAGSGADIGARLIADKLAERWGQPVVVENRPGGDGMVAINAFIGAHDDHVLFFGPSSSFIAHPYIHDKLSYDPRDLSPVARISSTLIAITVPPQLNVNSLKELFAKARAEPGTLNWVSITGATDMILRAFIQKSGLNMARVPYRNPVEGLTDAINGRMHLYWAAYAIVRLRYRGAQWVGGAIFLAYLVPPSILFIPLSTVVFQYGLFDTPFALILTYPTILIPFSTWLLMGYFKTIPFELEECALIDGASRWQILVKIILPLAVPGLISAFIFCFTLCWNEFIYALTFISASHNKTVPVAIVNEFVDGDIYRWGSLMAGALVGSLPLVVLYAFFVEHYVSAMTGAIKE